VRATCSCVTTSTSLAFRGVPTVQRTLHRTTAYSVSAATYSSVLRTTYYVLRTTYYVLMNPAKHPSASVKTPCGHSCLIEIACFCFDMESRTPGSDPVKPVVFTPTKITDELHLARRTHVLQKLRQAAHEQARLLHQKGFTETTV
jgi:hypothetical protein